MSFLKNRNIRIITIGSIFIVVNIVLGSVFKSYNSDVDITSRIQKEISNKLNLMESIMLEIDSTYRKDGLDALYESDYSSIYNEEGLAFAIISEDSLLFWTTPLIVQYVDSLKHLSVKAARYNNGYYISNYADGGKCIIVGLTLIKNDYDYSNQHINHDFHDSFDNIYDVSIIDYQANNIIRDPDGNFLFSIIINKAYCYTTSQGFCLFLLYVFGFFTIMYGLWGRMFDLYYPRYSKPILIIVFIFLFILVRLLLYALHIPPALYDSPLFSKAVYSPIIFGSSFGNFIMNVISVFSFSYLIYDDILNYKSFKPLKSSLQIVMIFVFFIYFFLNSILYVYVLNDFLTRSDIWFKLNDFQNLDYMAFIGIYVIMALSGSYFYLILILAYYCIKVIKNININIAASIYIPLSIPLFFIFDFESLKVYYAFFTIFFLSIHLVHLKKERVDTISLLLFYILLFASLTSYIVTVEIFNKEQNIRKEIITDLAFGRIGSFAEANFSKEKNEIVNDNLLESMLKRYYFSTNGNKTEIIDYISRTYFNGLWSKYNIQTTICFSNDKLLLSPNDTVSCRNYFDNLISEYGTDTSIKDFYLLEFSPNETSYFGIIDVYISDIEEKCSIYIEIFPKPVSEIKEYDKLIIDRTIFASGELNQYSFARYFFNELSYKIGEYEYEYNLRDEYRTDSLYWSGDYDGYNHLMFRVDKDEYLVLSTKLPDLTLMLAPFSYILICYFIGVVVLSVIIVIYSARRVRVFNSYSGNIQIVLVIIIFISLLIISVFSIYSIIKLDNKKDIDIITEKAFSIQNDLNTLVQQNGVELLNDYNTMKSITFDLSNTFSVDINIYDTSGKLVSSSLSSGNISSGTDEYMNPQAYNNLHNNGGIIYVQKENIDKYTFNSVYISIIDRDFGVVGYINIPHFIQQKESSNSLFGFIVTSINLYIVLIMVSLIIIYVVSRAITHPLRMLSDKLVRFDLFKHNEKIEWKANDEIGSLIKEYNRVVGELTVSAEMLAASERENAWREMARQIAHEVKNPLTPMKLSLQHLQRAWQKNDPDFEARLNRFTNTMIEQIDTLSVIATSFSDYAKIGTARLEATNILELLNNAFSLFKDANAPFAYTIFANKSYIVNVDRNQMTQVFNNIITNAIQAVSSVENGLIIFNAIEENGYVLISISDNGCGIPEEAKKNIFNPYFTTKTSGTGLGLSIVKNIINSFGGEIYFASEPNVGTVFYIKLKLIAQSICDENHYVD